MGTVPMKTLETWIIMSLILQRKEEKVTSYVILKYCVYVFCLFCQVFANCLLNMHCCYSPVFSCDVAVAQVEAEDEKCPGP